MHNLSSFDAIGRVCVPVEPSQVDEFDPAGVPTVGQLLRELDQTHAESMEEDVKMDDEETKDDKSPKRSEPGKLSHQLFRLSILISSLLQQITTGQVSNLTLNCSKGILLP